MKLCVIRDRYRGEIVKYQSRLEDVKKLSYPWQRGTNENTNDLPRQYFPKKINLSGYSHDRHPYFALPFSKSKGAN